MTRTQFRENYREVIENQAFSYNYSRTLGYMKGLDNVSAAGSHSLFISLENLGKWLLNLETGQVGGREMPPKMLSPGKLDSGEGQASHLRPVCGDYRIEQGVVYTMVREGDRLMIRVSGQNYQLFPLSPTRFFLKIAAVQITF
jgi:hypothetical protein